MQTAAARDASVYNQYFRSTTIRLPFWHADGDGGRGMSEEVYGPERARRLVAMLRALAERIQELDRAGRLLEATPELLKQLGTIRSELFHYEVRSTYDTPEVAESRRIVDDARRSAERTLDEPEDEEDPWRGSEET